jgi:hypothetical protein
MFELRTRFSNESKERWDMKFLEKEFGKKDINKIKKIWVCGPPIMNEDMDKAFEILIPKLNIKEGVVEIL